MLYFQFLNPLFQFKLTLDSLIKNHIVNYLNFEDIVMN